MLVQLIRTTTQFAVWLRGNGVANFKTMVIDPELINTLRAEIPSALAEIGEKYGIKIVPGYANYAADFSNGSLKLEFQQIKPDGTVMDKAASVFMEQAAFYGMDPVWLHQTFTYRGSVYTVKGMTIKSRKNLVHLTRADGKNFRGPAEMVIVGFKYGEKA